MTESIPESPTDVTASDAVRSESGGPESERPVPFVPTSLPPLRIRGLRLIGAQRSYTVDFTDDEHVARQFAVIAGEISTGKTSILELIDYCLASIHRCD